MKLELLTNATMVYGAIRFVSFNKYKQNQLMTINTVKEESNEPDYHKDEDQEQEQEEEAD